MTEAARDKHLSNSFFGAGLGEVDPEDAGKVRGTTIEGIIARAASILHPYSLDVRDVAWHSVYEVGHRITDGFDDVGEDSTRHPRVFLDVAHDGKASCPYCGAKYVFTGELPKGHH